MIKSRRGRFEFNIFCAVFKQKVLLLFCLDKGTVSGVMYLDMFLTLVSFWKRSVLTACCFSKLEPLSIFTLQIERDLMHRKFIPKRLATSFRFLRLGFIKYTVCIPPVLPVTLLEPVGRIGLQLHKCVDWTWMQIRCVPGYSHCPH